MSKTNLLLILATIVLVCAGLFRPGYFTMHDDMQVIRFQQMTKCLQDGQIPCRLSPDLGGGYTQPHFNYYSAFPYYLGSFLNLIGLSLIDTVKVVFFLAFLVAAFGAYYLATFFVGPSTATLVSILYTSSTYRLVNLYVRGALAETYALALLPLVLGLLFSLTKPSKSKVALAAVVLSFFLSCHPISILISLPLFILVLIYHLSNLRTTLSSLVLTLLLGVGLSAYYLLPAFLERNLISTTSLLNDYYQYALHFPTWRQLFLNLNWDYGPSRQGPVDGFSFHLGFAQILVLLTTPILLFKNKNRSYTLLFVVALGFLFMTHARSVAIWDMIPTLKFVQFPWRLLGPLSLLLSLLAGFWLRSFPTRYFRYLSILLVILSLAPMIRNYHFNEYFPTASDQTYLSGAGWDAQRQAASRDYLPAGLSDLPSNLAPALPSVLDSGKINLHYFDKRSNYFGSEIDVYSDSATIQFPIISFPQWQIHLDRNLTPAKLEPDAYERLTLKLSKGSHLIQGYFVDTPVRAIANLLTLVSFLALIVYL